MSAVLDHIDRWGGRKVAIFKLTQSGATGGTLDVSSFFSHIDYAHANDITTAIHVSCTWTYDSESITIGDEGSDGDTIMVLVVGRG